MARKRKSRPSSAKRNRRQNVKAAYAKAREDAQLAGVIPTTPEGAVRSERVDPATQDEQRFPGLDRAAIRGEGKGWEVPDHVKKKVIEVNAEALFEKRVMVDPITKIEVEVPNRKAQMEASKVLLLADEMQYKRDEPERAGKAAGGVTVNNQVAVFNASELYKAALAEVERDEIEEQIAAVGQAGAADQQVNPETNGHA